MNNVKIDSIQINIPGIDKILEENKQLKDLVTQFKSAVEYVKYRKFSELKFLIIKNFPIEDLTEKGKEFKKEYLKQLQRNNEAINQ